MSDTKAGTFGPKSSQASGLRRLLACLAVMLALSVPNYVVRANIPSVGAALPAQQEPGGSWKLISSSESDTWQGDNFHGLKSEYTPFVSGHTIGATYTQYNIQFTDQTDLTISSELTGSCALQWPGDVMPPEVIPGTSYPFNVVVDANATGSGFLGGTVNGYASNGEGSGNIAFAQVYLDVSGQVRSGHQETSSALILSPGSSEGEHRTLTFGCQVDIVTVTVAYLYQWTKSGCTATLKLPDAMEAGKEFTPLVTVVDSQQKPVKPLSEVWYYNGAASPSSTMKWDGKAATVEYEYVCPNETVSKRAKVAIPPADGCRASIILPEKVEPNQGFTPQAAVVNLDGQPVQPESEMWYYNGVHSSENMTWDGNEATVSYAYICPLDQKTGTAEIKIPASESAGWLVVFGGLAAVAAAGLAAVGVGTVLVMGNRQKDPKGPPPPKYILQLDKKSLEVKPKERAPLNIQAWRLKPDGSLIPAPEAVLQVNIPASPAGLAVAPNAGQGGMHCAFSVPRPGECGEVPVTITASAGVSKTRAQVTVKIVPLYELELDWRDPQQKRLAPDSKEIYAWARLTANPLPGRQSTPDKLAEKIVLAVEGPNSSLVELKTAPPGCQSPFVQKDMLWIPIRAIAAAREAGRPTLFARFEENDQQLEKSLELELSQELVLDAWVQGRKQADVIFNRQLTPPAWDFPEIIAYFHERGSENAPAHPGFAYQVTDDSIRFDPPVLRVRDIYAHDKDQYTLWVELDPSADLEQALGKDLQEHNGCIQADLTVKAKDGSTYSTGVSFQLRPELELFAHGCDISGRTYKNLDLEPLEFVADSDDRLCVIVGCCRSDKPEPRDADQVEQVDAAWWTFSAQLQGEAAGDYEMELSDEEAESERTVRVGAAKPMLYQPERAAQKLSLHLEGTPTDALPAHYLRTPLKLDLDLKASLPNLRLWVVPAKHRGSSEAWMLAFLGKDTSRPLPETILKVKTESANPEGGELLTNGGRNEISVITAENGSEQANLFYKGMNWSNYQQALFTVSCQLTDRTGDKESEAVKTTVNVQDNVKRMLADLLDRADTLNLNNHYFKDRSLGLTSLLDLTVSRPFVRGPVWNVCEQLSGNESAYAKGDKRARFAHDYVCSEFRDRIAEWLIKRRHYRAGNPERVQQIAQMNGIEFEHFIIADGLHNYEALFLSGMQPRDDPRGLDPWWKQAWDDPAYLDPNGLITNNWERYYCAETSAWLSVSLVPLAALGVVTGGGTVSALLPLIGPIIGVYAVATTGEVAPATVYEDGAYKWFRKDNQYIGLDVFIKDWVAANPDG